MIIIHDYDGKNLNSMEYSQAKIRFVQISFIKQSILKVMWIANAESFCIPKVYHRVEDNIEENNDSTLVGVEETSAKNSEAFVESEVAKVKTEVSKTSSDVAKYMEGSVYVDSELRGLIEVGETVTLADVTEISGDLTSTINELTSRRTEDTEVENK